MRARFTAILRSRSSSYGTSSVMAIRRASRSAVDARRVATSRAPVSRVVASPFVARVDASSSLHSLVRRVRSKRL